MNISLYDAFEARPDRLFFPRSVMALFPKGAQVLEVGCGKGDAAVYFAEQGFSVTAVDMKMQTIANEKVHYVCANAEQLPFPDQEFDVVYCEASFSSVKNKNNAAAEFYRVLRHGGLFVLCDFVLREQLSERSEVPSLKGAFTMEEYRDIFRHFIPVEDRDETSFLVQLMLHLCHTYGKNFRELLEFLHIGQAKYGFKTLIYTK